MQNTTENQNGKELMPLIQKDGELGIDCRSLYQTLGLKMDFNKWIKDYISRYGFEEGKDYNVIPFSSLTALEKSSALATKNGGGSNRIDYFLTIDMAKELAMVQQNDMGKKIRRYLIQVEREMRATGTSMAMSPTLFKDIRTIKINGKTLYCNVDVLKKLGYSLKGASSNRKNRYPNQFITQGHLIYMTEEFYQFLYHNMSLRKRRKEIDAMQPVLPLDFGAPIELKQPDTKNPEVPTPGLD